MKKLSVFFACVILSSLSKASGCMEKYFDQLIMGEEQTLGLSHDVRFALLAGQEVVVKKRINAVPGWYEHKRLSDLDIGPKVICIDDDVIIMEKVAGRHPGFADFFPLNNAFFDLMAKLKKLHAVPLPAGFLNTPFNYEELIREAIILAINDGWRKEEGLALRHLLLYDKLLLQSKTFSRKYISFCHNDLHAANLLVNGEQTTILDADFCGVGNRMFDLVALMVEVDPQGLLIDTVMAEHFGELTPQLKNEIEVMTGLYLLGAGYWRYRDGVRLGVGDKFALPFIEMLEKRFFKNPDLGA